MARPGRQGVDYFPLDVHLDNKVKFLIIKFGLEGLGAITTLYQEIYANGYWCKWGEDERLIFTHENNIEIDTLNEIVDEALKRGIFDEELFDKFGILTSAGVQKRYQKIVERRKDVEITKKYILIEGNFGTNEHTVIDECMHDVNTMHTGSVLSDNKNTQSKVKETTVKDNKEIHASIFNHWNDKGIIVHGELSNKMTKPMDKILKAYSIEEIKNAIDIYAEALESEFYFKHKYTLEKFLKQNNGVPDWVEEGSMYENYIEYKKNQTSELRKNNNWDDIDAS